MGKILGITLAFSACFAFAQEITVNQDGTATITLSKEQVEKCNNEGGCAMVSLKLLEAVVIETSKQMCGKEI